MGIALLAPGLVFSDDNDVIPDLIWISHQRRRESVDAKGHFALAPELVVEVLSPGTVNRVRDRDAKLALYSRQQVQDYWIVDPDSRLVEIYCQSGASGLVLSATLADGDTITSPLLPGFTCPVASLWVPPLGE